MFMHELESAHDFESCDLYFIVERERLFKVVYSYIICQAVVESDVNTGH